jgi:hypothetical protein
MTLGKFLLARIDEDAATNFVGADLGGSLTVSAQRWMVECEAKRRLVTMHSRPHTCANSSGEESGDYRDAEPCPTLELLALPYQDHAAYEDEWRL